MNKALLFCFFLFCTTLLKAQTTYYWVGGTGPVSFTAATSWNTNLDGTGSSRPTPGSNDGNVDILVVDGTNVGGATPVTGAITATVSSTNFGVLKLVNNATVTLQRTGGAGGTSTVIINGGTGDDLLINAGSTLNVNSVSTDGAVVLSFGAAATGLVSGTLIMSNSGASRISTATAGAVVFANGAVFKTSLSASYPFGNGTSQSVDRGVVFQPGASLYYEGGNSPMGNSSTFSAIDFRPGSNWYHRANNGTGSFTNTKSFGNIIVENNATLTADGPIYRIGNLSVSSGSSMVTHTSGQTVVLGDVTINGSVTAPASSTNTVVLGGNGLQTVSGAGTLTVPSLVVADNADVVLARNVTVGTSTNVYGKLNFGGNQITGAGTFSSRVNNTATGVTGNLSAGSYQLTGVAGTLGSLAGLTVTGTGIAANTNVVGFSSSNATINLSKPAVGSGTAVALTFTSGAATLETANGNGFDSTSGSVIATGNKTFQSSTNYIFDAATTKPFGFSSGFTGTRIIAGNLLFNAAVVTNISADVSGALQATAGKVTIRPLDTLRLLTNASLNGTYNGNTYFVTSVDASGNAGVFRRDNATGGSLFPIGTASYYLPSTLNPASASDFALNVFSGITANGQPTGTAFTPQQKQTVVDAVWNVNRVAGTGDANLQLQWVPQLEGTTLATFANAEIGIIRNTGTSWSLPFGTGDNVPNTADTTFDSFGQFSVGARPPANPFVFNTLPPKTYGDADFSTGVISSNTTTPITYTSSNTAVATVVNGNIHIAGTGTTTVTAQQASDGFYPAANVSQTLTVNKAPLTVKADRKTKPEGDPNPTLTATYTGFVLGETTAALLTPAVLTTTATTASPAGTYLITASGTTAANYSISFVNDSLIVRPRSAQTIAFPAFATKTYGAADFAVGAVSSNNTIPLTYTSSNTGVATVVGNNVRIVGAGTATITASQAGSDLYFPATPVSQTLTVNKASLTIRVADTTKNYGEPAPPFRIVYTGFVLGQTSNVLTTQPTVNTTATTLSAPGYYSLDPSGAAAANYNITYVSGRLTVYPTTGTGQSNLQAFMSNGNTLMVRIYSPAPDLGDVAIYDLNGKALRRKNVFMPQGFIATAFAINGMPSGIYVVQVIGKNTTIKLTVSIIH